MIEKTTHPAGFKVTDRRREHVGLIVEEAGPDSPQVSPEDFAAGTGPTADKPGWYHIETKQGGKRLRQVQRNDYSTPMPTPVHDVTLAEVRRAKSVIAGTYGTHATPLDGAERAYRYRLQELCRRELVGAGARPLTPRQQRRIAKKERRLTSTAGVK